MTDEEFYDNAVLNTQQGLMEMGGKLALLFDSFPSFLARMSFRIADKMLEERKRRREIEINEEN